MQPLEETKKISGSVAPRRIPPQMSKPGLSMRSLPKPGLSMRAPPLSSSSSMIADSSSSSNVSVIESSSSSMSSGISKPLSMHPVPRPKEFRGNALIQLPDIKTVIKRTVVEPVPRQLPQEVLIKIIHEGRENPLEEKFQGGGEFSIKRMDQLIDLKAKFAEKGKQGFKLDQIKEIFKTMKRNGLISGPPPTLKEDYVKFFLKLINEEEKERRRLES